MMERQRPQSKVTLEDLIRLKRAERPPQEFWTEFESQLRHKQLAAIVDKRPWWRRFSMANLAKLSVPVGATAIVALTLTSFRERFQTTPATDAVGTALSASAQNSMIVADAFASRVDARVDASILSAAQMDAGASLNRDAKLADASHHDDAIPVSPESDEILISRAEKETSLAQVILGIEENVTEAQPRFEEPVLVASLSNADADASGSQNIEGSEAASGGLTSSIDARRARLLVSVDSSESENRKDNSRVARTRDRIASRLNEQALSDSIRRLGLNGDSVSIKF